MKGVVIKQKKENISMEKTIFVLLVLISLIIISSCNSNEDGVVEPTTNGFSLLFNGLNSYIEFPFAENHDLFENFSIEAWVKFDSIAAGTIISKIILADSSDLSSSYSIYFDEEHQNKVIFSTLIARVEHKAISSIALSSKQWHHIVVVFTELNDGGEFNTEFNKKIYIGDVLVYFCEITAKFDCALVAKSVLTKCHSLAGHIQGRPTCQI